jgi:hypothetical protein
MNQNIKVIFLHHSVGLGILEDGNVREQLKQLVPSLELWDHGYNNEGLRDGQGKNSGQNYAVPEDDTVPLALAKLFAQAVTNPPANTFSKLLGYDVLIFKSCFPVSSISSDSQLAEYQNCYRQIRQIIDQHPDKLFIFFTQPPQTRLATNPEEGRRARQLAEWLKSGEFNKDAQNLKIFDLFNLLAENNPNSPDFNTLRSSYQRRGKRFWRKVWDSHPNQRANQAIGTELVKFLVETVNSFQKTADIAKVK